MGDFGVRPSALLVGQICDVEIAGLGGHIAKALDIEASSDTEAGELAAIMLSDQRAYPGIEVWERARQVAALSASALPLIVMRFARRRPGGR
jgi:hypothetical protein